MFKSQHSSLHNGGVRPVGNGPTSP